MLSIPYSPVKKDGVSACVDKGRSILVKLQAVQPALEGKALSLVETGDTRWTFKLQGGKGYSRRGVASGASTESGISRVGSRTVCAKERIGKDGEQMKTPEEMAERYLNQDKVVVAAINHDAEDLVKDAFLAGYQAAKDQLADADKVILQWISVKDRLPEEGQEVLVFGSLLNAPKLLGVRYKVLGDQDWKYTWQGDGYIFKQDYVTYWMPLPEPPKEKE